MIVTTTNTVAGYGITRHLGVCRGITVRSRSALGNGAGGWQSFFGGRLGIYVRLAENDGSYATGQALGAAGGGGRP